MSLLKKNMNCWIKILCCQILQQSGNHSLFQGRPPLPLKKVANGDIWFFTERDWSQGHCHGNNIAGIILFLLCVYYWCQVWRSLLQYFWRYSFSILSFKWNNLWCHHFPHLHNTKTWISLQRKKVFQKGKHHSSLLWKAFQTSSKYFLLQRHFK